MNYKMIAALIACSLLASTAMSAGASVTPSIPAVSSAAPEANSDDTMIIGACMATNLQRIIPGMTSEKIGQCSSGDSSKLPKCLGMNEADFMTVINACKSQLSNAKCVSAKMKVTLLQYAECGYEKDPEACYKSLGSTRAVVVKLSGDCTAEGAK